MKGTRKILYKKGMMNGLFQRSVLLEPITGAAMKLAINLPLMVAWQAYGEAFAIARSAGWEPRRLVDLLVESNGGNKARCAKWIR